MSVFFNCSLKRKPEPGHLFPPQVYHSFWIEKNLSKQDTFPTPSTPSTSEQRTPPNKTPLPTLSITLTFKLWNQSVTHTHTYCVFNYVFCGVACEIVLLFRQERSVGLYVDRMSIEEAATVCCCCCSVLHTLVSFSPPTTLTTTISKCSVALH